MAYRVCIISGGGIRGIIPAVILNEMIEEAKSLGGKGNISDICDYVVGTSVGGIVGAGFVASRDGKTPLFTSGQVAQLLQDNAAKIFPEDANYWQHIALTSMATTITTGVGAAVSHYLGYSLVLMGSVSLSFGILAGVVAYRYADIFDGLFAPKYDRDGIDSVLNDKFQDLRLNDTIVPFTTTSYSLDSNSPRVWSTFKALVTKNDNFFIKDALGATSAAPTFFPHKETHSSTGAVYHDIDGGVFANAPAILGIAVLMRYAPVSVVQKVANEGVALLMIGTGHHDSQGQFSLSSSFMEGKLGYGVVDPLILKVMDAVEKDSLIQARYVHSALILNPCLSADLMPMDQADREHTARLSQVARDYVEQHKSEVSDYTNCMFQGHSKCTQLITEDMPDYAYHVNIFFGEGH